MEPEVGLLVVSLWTAVSGGAVGCFLWTAVVRGWLLVLGECLWTVTWVSFAAAVFAVTGGRWLSRVLTASGYSCAFV